MFPNKAKIRGEIQNAYYESRRNKDRTIPNEAYDEWELIRTDEKAINNLLKDENFPEVEVTGYMTLNKENPFDFEYVGNISYVYYPATNHIRIVSGKIFPDYRGQGLYPYIRRALMNVIDKKKLTLTTRAEPFEIARENKAEKQQRREELKDHYTSYGDKDSIHVDYDSDEDPNDVVYISRFPNE